MEFKLRFTIKIYIIEEVEGQKRKGIFTDKQKAIRQAEFLADYHKKQYFVSEYEENEYNEMLEYVTNSIELIKPKNQEA